MPTTRRTRGTSAAPPAAARASGLEQARALALRVLAFHARSEAQLRDRLTRAGHEDRASEVISWLKRLGYVDDAAYAAGRARALLGSGRTGPRLAERKLVAAGISPDVACAAVAAALAEVGGADEPAAGKRDDLELCRAAAERRLRGRAAPASLDPRARARLARHLLSRGFSAASVSRVLRMELDPDA